MLCCRRTEKISWTDLARNEVESRKKVDFIYQVLHRNCHLNYAIELKIKRRKEETGRRERRSQQLLDDLKKKRRYWKFERDSIRWHSGENALQKIVWTIVKTDYVRTMMIIIMMR